MNYWHVLDFSPAHSRNGSRPVPTMNYPTFHIGASVFWDVSQNVPKNRPFQKGVLIFDIIIMVYNIFVDRYREEEINEIVKCF